MSQASFFWHDYETFGTDPRRDRPVQFAGQRTTLELEPVGEPVSFFCKPARDVLPQPAVCLITGITPQFAEREGVIEAEFAARVHEELRQPGTCGVGYNSMRFDDEFTRNLLYRNFYDPYEREWKDGNSRWDLIDLARMCYALRPQGIEWPYQSEIHFREDRKATIHGRTPQFSASKLVDLSGRTTSLTTRHTTRYPTCTPRSPSRACCACASRDCSISTSRCAASSARSSCSTMCTARRCYMCRRAIRPSAVVWR